MPSDGMEPVAGKHEDAGDTFEIVNDFKKPDRYTGIITGVVFVIIVVTLGRGQYM